MVLIFHYYYPVLLYGLTLQCNQKHNETCEYCISSNSELGLYLTQACFRSRPLFLISSV